MSCSSTGDAWAAAISPNTSTFQSSTDIAPPPPGSTIGVGHTGPSSRSEYCWKKGCASAVGASGLVGGGVGDGVGCCWLVVGVWHVQQK